MRENEREGRERVRYIDREMRERGERESGFYFTTARSVLFGVGKN